MTRSPPITARMTRLSDPDRGEGWRTHIIGTLKYICIVYQDISTSLECVAEDGLFTSDDIKFKG